jgi:hypothetical protein
MDETCRQQPAGPAEPILDQPHLSDIIRTSNNFHHSISNESLPCRHVTCHRNQSHVRFGSLADICSAIGNVRFAPNSDRESDFPQTVMSALPPKADMCSALAHVRYGPIADSCTAANSPIRSPRELWQSTRIGFRRSILSWETSRDPVSGRSWGRTSSSPLGQSAKQVRSGVSSRPATSQLRSMSFGSHPCRAPAHRVCD